MLRQGKLKRDDIVLTSRGTLGNIAHYDGKVPYEHIRINSGMLILRPDHEHLTPHFLYQYLRSDSFTLQLDALLSGSAQPQIPVRDLRFVRIPLPPLPEQRRIADILSTWDAAIALTERLIAALERRKRGLMQRLLTGKVRFPGFVQSNAVQKAKYGDAPAEWDYVPFEQIAHEVSETNESDLDLTVLSCTKYDGLVDSLEYFGRQIYSEDTSNYKLVARGQFAYATNHIEEGSIGYQDLYDLALISPMYTAFETDGSLIDDSYLYKLFKTELYRHIFEVNTSGSINRRGGLRWTDFQKIEVPLPPLDEQRAIAEVLELADDEIHLVEQRLAALKEQKKGLMQCLLTGRIRVRV